MSNQTRDAFEVLVKSRNGENTRLLWKNSDGDYNALEIGFGWIAWQAATLAAAPQHAETEAWLIEWGSDAERKRLVYTHNAIGDYRHLYKDATVHELVKRAAPPPTGTPQGKI